MEDIEDAASRKYKKRESIKLDYVSIFTPKNMRSVYWKYFGYPTDEENHIITKDNVVCTLCHLVMRNHNNTTNLRAHMQSTHKEIFGKICKENDIVVPPRKTPLKSKESQNPLSVHLNEKKENLTASKYNKIKMETRYNHLKNSCDIFVNALTYEDTEENIEKTTEDEISNSEYVQMDYEEIGISNEPTHDISNGSSYVGVELNKNVLTSRSNKETLNLISSMVIKDLKDTSIITDSGFFTLITGISKGIEIPTVDEVDTIIDTQYTEKMFGLFEEIKKYSEINPFSISFEVWEDICNKQFVSVYISFISEEPNPSLKNVLLNTVVLNKYTNFDEILSDFNLKNCVAAIVNKNSLELEVFLCQNDIPTIQCFLSVRDKCLERIFDLASVSSTFDQVLDIIRQHADELQNISIPNIIPSFPWTKINLMKFFCESVSWPDEFNDLISEVKSIIFILSSLETTMDTLVEEETPLSSLIKPLVMKLLEKYFLENSSDNSLTAELKSVIKLELTESILSNETLTITALLDPRFQRYLSNDAVDSVLSILNEKIKTIDTKKLLKTSSITKRTSLKHLFESDLTSSSTSTTETDVGVNNDIIKYRNNAYADFDQSPLVWWNKNGFMYETLKKLSDKYNCIPFCLNYNFKKSANEQIDFYKRRCLLPDKLKTQLLFLNYNM